MQKAGRAVVYIESQVNNNLIRISKKSSSNECGLQTMYFNGKKCPTQIEEDG